MRILTQHFLAAALCAAACVSVQAADPPPSSGVAPTHGEGRPDSSKSQTVSGIVDGYNLDPRGMVSGIVVKDDAGKVAQFNMPPEMAGSLAAAIAVGQKVQATGMAEIVSGDRACYRLSSLSSGDGKQYTVPGRNEWQVQHVDGVVKQLNRTPRGEVDGAILDSGDFVHVGPHEAAQLNLAVGQKVSADGWSRSMLMGHSLIVATKVNGTTIQRPRPMDGPPGRDGAQRGGPGRGGPGGPGGPQGDDQRGPRPMRGGGPGGPGGFGGRNGGFGGGGPDGHRPPRPMDGGEDGPPPPPQ
jgi:hypothetical protein